MWGHTKEGGRRGVVIQDKSAHSYFFEADQRVVTPGSISNNALISKLGDNVCELHEVGDCRVPRRILEAVYESTEVGLKI